MDTIAYIRAYSSGVMIVIDQLQVRKDSPILNLEQALLTEALSGFLMDEFSHVLCHFQNVSTETRLFLEPLLGLFQGRE